MRTSQQNNGWFVLIISALLLGVFAPSLAQKWEHKYKWRKNKLYKEGLKLKKKKNVSGTLELKSLVVRGAGNTGSASADSVSVYFFSPVDKGVELTLQNPPKNYFLDNLKSNMFDRNWNTFTWSAKILQGVGLAPSDLMGVVTALSDGDPVYVPVCFHKPSANTQNLTMQAVLKPDKDMVLDIVLTAASTHQTVKKWTDVQIASDALYTLDLPAEVFSTSGEHFKLEAIEKSAAGPEYTTLREHPFRLFLFSNASLSQ